MRVLGSGIEVQGAHLLATKRAARDHPLNRFFKHTLGEATFENLLRRRFLDTAGVPGVFVIDLVGRLVAGEFHLVDIDDDHVIAAIDVRGVARRGLAAQNVGDDRREATDDKSVGIDNVPVLFDLGRFDRPGLRAERFHGCVLKAVNVSIALRFPSPGPRKRLTP